MPFGAVFSDRFLERVATLHEEGQGFVGTQVRRLLDDPRSLGRDPHFPYLPDGQIFQFKQIFRDGWYYFDLFFKYSRDGKSLYIFDLAWRVRPT